MFPTLIKAGGFEITTFGVMMFLAFIIGGWVLTRQLRQYGIDEDVASSITMAAALGGIIGAKIYYAILFRDWHLLFDRAGLVWYGGLIGGALACTWVLRRRHVDFMTGADVAAPALSIGYALGRIGCFLVGDDYGAPTARPWGVAFPEGLPPTSVPVHPAQLYEAAVLVPIAWVLVRWRRNGVDDRVVFGRYLVMAGALRFAIEFVRVNERLVGPLTLAHMISAGIVGVGIVMLMRSGRPVSAPTPARRSGRGEMKRQRPA